MEVGFCSRFRVFISERFPLLAHSLMLALFSGGNLALGRALGLVESTHLAEKFFLFFVMSLLFFLRLRVFDELKDLDHDKKFNPERALARGVVSVPEARAVLLGLVLFELFFLSIGVAYLRGESLLASPYYLLPLFYSFLMFEEFFIGDFLRPHLTTYATMHTISAGLFAASMLFYMTNASWNSVLPFLSIFIGLNWTLFNFFEFARKTFDSSEERDQVESYSKLFGRGGSVALSLSQVVITAVIVSSLGLSNSIGLMGLYLITLLFVILCLLRVFSAKAVSAPLFRNVSTVVLLLSYLCLVLMNCPLRVW
ncbi:manganese transporter permease [bacterium]|nr:manganese transporter permease [bacterium]